MSIDSVMMTTYSGGLYDSIGDGIGNIVGIILCLIVAARYMNSVPPHKSLSWLVRERIVTGQEKPHQSSRLPDLIRLTEMSKGFFPG